MPKAREIMRTQTIRKDESQGSRNLPNKPSSSSSIERPRARDQRSEPDRRPRSQLEYAAKGLQEFMRRLNAEKGVSQYQVFRSSLPIVGFVSLLTIAVTLPRIRCAGHLLVQDYDLKRLVGIILGGLGAEMIVWRCVIWVVAAGLTAFCEANLTEVFEGNRVVDAEGLELTQVELFKGGFI